MYIHHQFLSTQPLDTDGGVALHFVCRSARLLEWIKTRRSTTADKWGKQSRCWRNCSFYCLSTYGSFTPFLREGANRIFSVTFILLGVTKIDPTGQHPASCPQQTSCTLVTWFPLLYRDISLTVCQDVISCVSRCNLLSVVGVICSWLSGDDKNAFTRARTHTNTHTKSTHKRDIHVKCVLTIVCLCFAGCHQQYEESSCNPVRLGGGGAQRRILDRR